MANRREAELGSKRQSGATKKGVGLGQGELNERWIERR